MGANGSTVYFYDLWCVYRVQKLLSGRLSHLCAEGEEAGEGGYVSALLVQENQNQHPSNSGFLTPTPTLHPSHFKSRHKF